MRFISIIPFNKALLAKQVWEIHTNTENTNQGNHNEYLDQEKY